MKKKYVIIIVILLFIICIPLFTLLLVKTPKGSPITQNKASQLPLKLSSLTKTYITKDEVTAPTTSVAAVEGTLSRQAKESNGHIWQQFIFSNKLTGSQWVIFEEETNGIQFEKMTTQNWSPTNRFFYVFFDSSSGARNILVFETDGRFMNDKYYLEPITLGTFQTISQASWLDGETLSFSIKNQQTNTVTKYELDLNDSNGVVKQIE